MAYFKKQKLINTAVDCIDNSFLGYGDKIKMKNKVKDMKPKELQKTIDGFNKMFLNDYSNRLKKIQGI